MIYHPLEQKAEAIPEQIYITTILVQKAYRRHGIAKRMTKDKA